MSQLPQLAMPACAVQKWLKAVGKEQKRKGKRLYMPMRIALTVRLLVFHSGAFQNERSGQRVCRQT